MRDILPEPVLVRIGDQFRDGVERAHSRYQSYREDEDSVTGALGGVFDVVVSGQITLNSTRYSWNTRTTKFRGRGSGAYEKQVGADGIFEIEIFNEVGQQVARKSLPFQAKKEARGKVPHLAEQAALLANLPGVAASSTIRRINTVLPMPAWLLIMMGVGLRIEDRCEHSAIT